MGTRGKVIWLCQWKIRASWTNDRCLSEWTRVWLETENRNQMTGFYLETSGQGNARVGKELLQLISTSKSSMVVEFRFRNVQTLEKLWMWLSSRRSIIDRIVNCNSVTYTYELTRPFVLHGNTHQFTSSAKRERPDSARQFSVMRTAKREGPSDDLLRRIFPASRSSEASTRRDRSVTHKMSISGARAREKP